MKTKVFALILTVLLSGGLATAQYGDDNIGGIYGSESGFVAEPSTLNDSWNNNNLEQVLVEETMGTTTYRPLFRAATTPPSGEMCPFCWPRETLNSDGTCPSCDFVYDPTATGTGTVLDTPIQDSLWLFALIALCYLGVILYRTFRIKN